MYKNLVIVESPAKAKTIEKFLGKEYKVLSSYGHICDLKKKEFSINTETFEPLYEIPAEKEKLVSSLRSEVKKAEMVWLASDEDREGEAISWHLFEVLGLKAENTRRIVFHEITKNAILQAIENPRSIDVNLVNAQQARRVLDRIVGFLIGYSQHLVLVQCGFQGDITQCGIQRVFAVIEQSSRLNLLIIFTQIHIRQVLHHRTNLLNITDICMLHGQSLIE